MIIRHRSIYSMIVVFHVFPSCFNLRPTAGVETLQTFSPNQQPLRNLSKLLATVYIDLNEPVSDVGDLFLCFCLDWWPPDKCDYGTCAWGNSSLLNLDLSSPNLIAAVSGLAPFALRLGGSLQFRAANLCITFADFAVTCSTAQSRWMDHVTYNVDGGHVSDPCPPFQRSSTDVLGFVGGCLPAARWDAVHALCESCGCEIIFELNALRGRRQVGPREWVGRWDASNAAQLILTSIALLFKSWLPHCVTTQPNTSLIADLCKYTRLRGYHMLAWEFGNEIGDSGGIAASIPPSQYAADLLRLQEVGEFVYGTRYKSPLFVAADIFFDEVWYEILVDALDNPFLGALTVYFYPLGAGNDSSLGPKMLSPVVMAQMAHSYAAVRTLAKSIAPNLELWIGESGGAYNSGSPGKTDAFMSAFWYLDQLGTAAANNYTRVCRQTLVGGNYGLLMGSKVLKTTAVGPPSIRAYAHCHGNTKGAVTYLIMSLHLNASTIVALGSFATFPRDVYHLTPANGDVHSKRVLLNSIELQLDLDGKLPPLLPITQIGSSQMTMGPHSVAFVVVASAKAKICS